MTKTMQDQKMKLNKATEILKKTQAEKKELKTTFHGQKTQKEAYSLNHVEDRSSGDPSNKQGT